MMDVQIVNEKTGILNQKSETRYIIEIDNQKEINKFLSKNCNKNDMISLLNSCTGLLIDKFKINRNDMKFITINGKEFELPNTKSYRNWKTVGNKRIKLNKEHPILLIRDIHNECKQ